MGRQLAVPVMVGSTVYDAGTDEADIVGVDTIKADDVWAGESRSPVVVSVVDSEEFEKAAQALSDANEVIEELRARVAELEGDAAGDGDATGGDEKGAYDDLTVVALKEEIDKRNEGRADEAKLSKSGDKAALVAVLVADDKAQEN